MRPSRRDSLLTIAAVVAQRGTCDRKRVGAVIAREGRIISIGYNGAPPGLPHCEENFHGWWSAWDVELPGVQPEGDERGRWATYKAEVEGCRNATHAEANALAFAARYGVSTDQAELYVTLAPCETCARLLIAAGIVRVEYEEPYRDRAGIELLGAAGIDVFSSN